MTKDRRLGLLTLVAVFFGLGSHLAGAPQSAGTPDNGPKLTYAEKSRTKADGREVVTCVLLAEGFPKDKRCLVAGRWMNGRTAEISRGARVDESGRVLGPGGDELELGLAEMQPGEFVQFALLTEDGSAKAFIQITPFPYRAEGEGGCRLSVQAIAPNREIFEITGAGFQPDKELDTVSTSSGETMKSTMKGRPDGTLRLVILPAVVGKTGGDATYSASDSKCSVKVLYKWGDEMAGAVGKTAKPPS